jgi:hypothetical protein
MQEILRDYQHASKIFVGNKYARSPKYKWLFHVHFFFTKENDDIDLLVKNVELPKFTPVIKDMNQYNHRVWTQTQVKYDPVTITFHDDNSDGLRKLWTKYYQYYFRDGTYTASANHLTDDRYTADRNQNQWGMDQGVNNWFLDKINIYSFHGQESSIITLWRPVISSFTHDQHDNFDGQGIMDAKMTLHYTAVNYSTGNAMAAQGFGTQDRYDLTPSPNENGKLPATSIDSSIETPLIDNVFNPTIGTDPAYNIKDPYTNSIVNPDSTFPLTAFTSLNSNYQYPTAETYDTTGSSYNVSNATNTYADLTSDGKILSTLGDQVYPTNSYQAVLHNKGYTVQQIESASNYLGQYTLGQLADYNLVQLSEMYISKPNNLIALPELSGLRPPVTAIDLSDPLFNTQIVFNGLDWKKKLLDKGYTSAEIAVAANQISLLNIKPGADLVVIAERYILYNRQTVINNQ